MKRIITFLCLASVIFTAAAISHKECRKLIKQYDVCDSLRGVSRISPYDFWSIEMRNDKELNKFNRNIQKNGGAQREAFDNITKTAKLYPENDPMILWAYQPYCDSVMAEIGAPAISPDARLYVVDSPDVDTYLMLTDNDGGFAICVTSAAMQMPGFNRYVMKSFATNGLVKGAFRMPLRAYFYDAQATRRANLWLTAAGVGLVVGTAALEVANSKYDNDRSDEVNIYDNSTTVINKNDDVKRSRPGFHFLEKQTYEADLLAYRFMEAMGNADAYLTSLKILGSAPDSGSNYEEATPSIALRLSFLDYVSKH